MDGQFRLRVCVAFHLYHAVIGNSFMSYLEAFKPFLLQGLKKIDEYQVRNSQCSVVRN